MTLNMRWIAFFLLLLNLGLFTWYMATPPSESGTGIAGEDRAGQGRRLVMISEASPGALPAAEAASASISSVTAQEQHCTLIGPFPQIYRGQDIVQRLKALQIQGDLREIEMQGQMRYWVFLPPLHSRREAFNKLRELQAQGIDSYVIPKGTLADGISFGIFSERARAELLTEELTSKGIGAKFREEPQIYLERWIVLMPGAAERLAAEFWQQLGEEYPELGRRHNLCSEVTG
ncbi:hypothetical protein [uncultured Microbulbifer sp.]|uniref:SPOR domain-containing protein n=2 Tax=Microbulbifer TaxID=48073 RepID=UPI00261C306A|nr:hypothetical protein [uncultured Microbulbifer sp.]